MLSKRALSLLGILAIIAMLVAACGGTPTPTPVPPKPAEPTKAPATAPTTPPVTAPTAAPAPAPTTPPAPAPTATTAAKPLVFGVVLVGPYNDHSWSEAHYTAAQYMEKLLAPR